MRRAVIISAAVALLGACGTAVQQTQTTKSGAIVVLSALDSTAATKTARFDMRFDEHSGAGGSVRVRGVVDFARDRLDGHLDVHGSGSSQSADMRLVGHTLYMKVNAGVWTSMPNSSSKSSSGSDPSKFLDDLRGVTDDLHQTGHGSSHGDRTTVYSGTVDLEKAAARVAPADRDKIQQSIDQLGTAGIPVKVEIDARNRVRKFQLTIDGSSPSEGHVSASIKMEFYDFGVAADIEAPADVSP